MPGNELLFVTTTCFFTLFLRRSNGGAKLYVKYLNLAKTSYIAHRVQIVYFLLRYEKLPRDEGSR